MVRQEMRSTHTKKAEKEILEMKPGYSDEFLLNQARLRDKFYPTTMEDETVKTLRGGIANCKASYEIFEAEFIKMNKRELAVCDSTKKHVQSLKNQAGQVADALARINKLIGVDFDLQVHRLERFADAVDRLDKLNRSGKLGAVAAAIAGL